MRLLGICIDLNQSAALTETRPPSPDAECTILLCCRFRAMSASSQKLIFYTAQAMSAVGHYQTYALQKPMSALPPRANMCGALAHICFGPCVDGSELARAFFHVCSIGRSSHVFGLSARHTGPLAIMPSADQVPVKSSHSTMLWPMWVVLIAGSTGSALRAVRPFQPSHHAGWPARFR